MSNRLISLSIIIPARNEENHLKLCLDAIKHQTVLPDEVIVVDNDSTDQTVRVAQNYPFVKLVSEKRRGIAYARDRGFNSAKARFIARIDSDTILPPDWVERVKIFYGYKTNSQLALTGGATFRNMPFPGLAGWLQEQLAFRMSWLALSHHILWGSNMVIPKSSWEKVKGQVCHVPIIHEDIDIAIHLHRLGVKIVYLPSLKVSTILKRIYTDQSKLWFNLKWWPRTLKRHGKKRWVIALFAAICVYSLARITGLLTKERAYR